jgi:hypothetical protein
MTDAEWWETEQQHSQGMVSCLRRETKVTRTKAGKRKLRLFACGVCRVIWDLLPDPRLRAAVEQAERFCDGQGSDDDLEITFRSIRSLGNGTYEKDSPGVRQLTAKCLAISTTHSKAFSAAFASTTYPVPLAGYRIGDRDGNAIVCDLFRCVFGNPYRPVSVETSWLKWNDGTVPMLARTIYDERAFDRLPILADALQDAGCDNADILSHCRGPGPHVRGCWVLDLMLGKG